MSKRWARLHEGTNCLSSNGDRPPPVQDCPPVQAGNSELTLDAVMQAGKDSARALTNWGAQKSLRARHGEEAQEGVQMRMMGGGEAMQLTGRASAAEKTTPPKPSAAKKSKRTARAAGSEQKKKGKTHLPPPPPLVLLDPPEREADPPGDGEGCEVRPPADGEGRAAAKRPRAACASGSATCAAAAAVAPSAVASAAPIVNPPPPTPHISAPLASSKMVGLHVQAAFPAPAEANFASPAKEEAPRARLVRKGPPLQPGAVMPPRAASDGVVIRFKRSRKGGVKGGVTFDVDFGGGRIESLPTEELIPRLVMPDLNGRKLVKRFERRAYSGLVSAFDASTGYRVTYDDGDVEDLYLWDLIPLLQD